MVVFTPFRKRFGILTLIQVMNLLFPIGIYYLLITRINLVQIGEITSWQMFFFILANLSNYNFPLILIPFNDKLRESPRTLAVFWSQAIKLRIILSAFLVMIVFLVFIFYSCLSKVIVLSSFLIIGKLFNPSQFLSVLSYNNLLLFYNFFSKSIPLILIFFFVDCESWQWTNFMIGISEFVISIVFVFYLKWGLRFHFLNYKKEIAYLMKERKQFYNQCIFGLIVFITIPFTHLFFGAYCAGVVSIIEKLTSVVRIISGNLFYALLPYFNGLSFSKNVAEMRKMYKKSFVLAILLFISINVLVFVFRDLVIEIVKNESIFYYLVLTSFVVFPVIVSSPFQVVLFKLNKKSKIYLFSKIQLAFLVTGLYVLGNLFGAKGVVISILLHEFVCFYLYKNEQMNL